MTVLYLSDIRFPLERANGVHTMETCAALAERGHDVHLLVRPDTATPARDPCAYYGIAPTRRLRFERAPVFGPPFARRAAYLALMVERLLDRRPWDAVFTPDLFLAGAALRVPARMRPPVVYESHNFRPSFAGEMSGLVTGMRAASPLKLRRLLRRERRVWRSAEGYVATTAVLAGELRERFGARPRVIVAPNGVRLERARAYAPPPRAGAPIVAYAGHFYPYNGADVLVEALALLPGVRGLIIGGHPRDAADGERLGALVRTRGLTNRVTFTGLVPPGEVIGLLRGADVLVQPITSSPYTRYASPMKLFDYMAAGRPIVASDIVSLREVVADGRTARLVRPGSAEALAEGIRGVLADPAAADRMGHAAFDAAATYTWARRAERIERLLDEVVAEPSR